MRFIRHIIIALAFIAAFICVSIISVTEPSNKKTDLDKTEDKWPVAKIVLSNLNQLLTQTENIPLLNLLPMAKVGANYELEIAQDLYGKTSNSLKNNPNITKEIAEPVAAVLDVSKENTNWLEVFKRIKEILSKDWFRS